ncbi:MAG TPA: hypothetical protein PKD27_02050 [Tepidiformaceae bacterium]|nr:hypothetical protein [Tepidiformaceae bacterium]
MTSAAVALRFPSLEWFEALKGIYNQEVELQRRNGQADTTMAVRCGDEIYRLVFAVYSITEVSRINESGLNDVDFYLELAPATWREMLEDIKKHGRAEGQYTLNSLDGADPDGIARSRAGYSDGDARDAFYRFNQSFQDLFDLSARLETTY